MAFATSSSASSYPFSIKYSRTSAISPVESASRNSSDAFFDNSKLPSSRFRTSLPSYTASSIPSCPTYIPEITPIIRTIKQIITRYLCHSEMSSLGIRFIRGFLTFFIICLPYQSRSAAGILFSFISL